MADMTHIDATHGDPAQPIAHDDWARIRLVSGDLPTGAPRRYQGAILPVNTPNLRPEPQNHRRNHPVVSFLFLNPKFRICIFVTLK